MRGAAATHDRALRGEAEADAKVHCAVILFVSVSRNRPPLPPELSSLSMRMLMMKRYYAHQDQAKMCSHAGDKMQSITKETGKARYYVVKRTPREWY